jgi:hypothetical protein
MVRLLSASTSCNRVPRESRYAGVQTPLNKAATRESRLLCTRLPRLLSEPSHENAAIPRNRRTDGHSCGSYNYVKRTPAPIPAAIWAQHVLPPHTIHSCELYIGVVMQSFALRPKGGGRKLKSGRSTKIEIAMFDFQSGKRIARCKYDFVQNCKTSPRPVDGIVRRQRVTAVAPGSYSSRLHQLSILVDLRVQNLRKPGQRDL